MIMQNDIQCNVNNVSIWCI